MADDQPSTTKGSGLAVQDLATLDIKTLTPLSPEVISRQATINIGAPPNRLLSVGVRVSLLDAEDM